jgi:uncharacterized membrane protein YuzA (DUF378 family)
MKTIDMLTRILVIVGGLNWGLVGIAQFDLVAAIFGSGSLLSNVVYSLVGISAVVQVVRLATPERSKTTQAVHFSS